MPGSFLLSRRDGFARSADGWEIPADRLRLNADQSHRDLACPTQLALERWTLRHLRTIAHEQRVLELATDLFDITRSRHDLQSEDLRLLRWAAVVHDVGRAICDETHPRQGVRLLRSERTLPLSPTDRRLLSYLTLHHRGPVPPAGSDEVLCQTDDAHRLLRILALLRVADGLDNRALHRHTPHNSQFVFGLTEHAGRSASLRITCYTTLQPSKLQHLLERRKKFRLLEQLLDCQVQLKVASLGG